MDQATRRRSPSNDEESAESFSDNFNPTRPPDQSIAACPSPGAISNLCSATLGAGALSLPYAFSLTGLIPGVVLLLLSGHLTILSIDVIISSCVHTNLFKYEDVAVSLAGRSAGRALEASLLVFCFGTAVAYIVAIGDIMDQFARSVFRSSGDDDRMMSIYSRERVMISFWLLVMFPLSLQRHMEGLERFSSLGVLSIIFLVLAVVIHSIKHGELLSNGKTGLDDNTAKHLDIRTMLWPDSFWDIVQAFPIVIFAFSCQVNVCAIFEELRPGDAISIKKRVMKKITRFGITLCITLYLAIGIFGYLDFSEETMDNILKNYDIPMTHDSLMTAASIFVAVAIIVAYPFNILPARVTLKLIWNRIRVSKKLRLRSGFLSRLLRNRRSRGSSTDETSTSPQVDNYDITAFNDESNDGLEPLLFGDDFEQSAHIPPLSLSNGSNQVNASNMEAMNPDDCTSTLEHFILTLCLSGSALIVALLIPGISVIFGLMGGTAASIISFILPGMFLRQMADVPDDEIGDARRRKQKLISKVFVGGGIVIGVLSTGVTLYGLF